MPTRIPLGTGAKLTSIAFTFALACIVAPTPFAGAAPETMAKPFLSVTSCFYSATAIPRAGASVFGSSIWLPSLGGDEAGFPPMGASGIRRHRADCS
ncbi:hypothetical protein [Sphingomonas sp. R86521]|uniref:hypothetical protein n=1 Tax=Sphingomonas sp. R86521 TaxID=3093860 RepID=UPI0036D2714A